MKSSYLVKIFGVISLWASAFCVTFCYAQESPRIAPFISTSGHQGAISDFNGKWTVVNFWAPWCPACMKDVPVLNALSQNSKIVVLGVAMDYGPDPGSSVLATIRKFGMAFTHQIYGGSRNNENGFYRQVGPVDFFPTTYLYNPSGKLVAFLPGQLSEGKVEATIRKLTPK